MKKNYVYLTILVVATIVITLVLASIYKMEVSKTSYSYNKMNKITALEYDEYIMEHTDTIIFISDKNNLKNNKNEKSFVKKLEKLNLLEITIYIDKEEVDDTLIKKLKDNYSYKYDANKLPAILVIDDGSLNQVAHLDEDADIDSIIDYEVFE